ncbi:MAG: hypothetical protein JNK23_21005 [Opitutaceae bacterium]|nr:hypothetical protein [Opitutaceae bacterium]
MIIRLGVGDSVEERHVRLDDIAPEIAVTERRSFTALVIMLALAAIFACAAWKVSGPSYMEFLLRVLFAGMAGGCVVAMFVAFARVPTATVKSRDGEVLFQLRREQNVAADYEVFLLNLQRRLKHRNGDSTS